MGFFDRWKKKKDEEVVVPVREPGAWRQARADVKNDGTYTKGDVTAATQQAWKDIKDVGRKLVLKGVQEARADVAFLKGVANSLIGRVVGLGDRVRDGANNISENIQKNNLIKKINGHLGKINQAKAAVSASQTNVGNMLSEAEKIARELPADADEEVVEAAQQLVADVQKEKTAIDQIVASFASRTMIIDVATKDLENQSLEELESTEKLVSGYVEGFSKNASDAKASEKTASSLVSKYKSNDRKLKFQKGAIQGVTKARGLFKKGVKFLGAAIAAPFVAVGSGAAKLWTDAKLHFGPKIQSAKESIGKCGTFLNNCGIFVAKGVKASVLLGFEATRFAELSQAYTDAYNEYVAFYPEEELLPEGCAIDFDNYKIELNLNAYEFGSKEALAVIGELKSKNNELETAVSTLGSYNAEAKKKTSGGVSRH